MSRRPHIPASLVLLLAACSGETPAESACRVDTDCHGDRVCESGECVEPDDGWTGQGGSAASTTGSGGAGQSSSGEGAGSSTGATTSASSASSAASSGSGGSGGFAQATPISIGDVVTEGLTPTGAEDFYAFSGTKGEALAIFVTAQAPSSPFDPDTIDTVITLYNASKQVIAENDDGFPRVSTDSELLTVLPATGQYYLRVTECWTWAGMPGVCGDPKGKTYTDYQLALLELDPSQGGVVEAIEPDDTAGTANAMEYEPNPNGGYYATLVYGTFKNGSDKDWFDLTFPFDVDVSVGRPVGYFVLMPSGDTGNGSTTPLGLVTLLDAATLTKVAEIDGSVLDASIELAPPLTLGTSYLLSVEHPGSALGSNDFYVVKHYGAGSNPLEANESGNGSTAGAETLTVDPNPDGTYSGYIEGDIATTTDLDHFSATVPPGTTHVSAFCGAQRLGSGLRNFTLSLLQEGGAQFASIVESATADAALLDVSIPGGSTKVLLRAASTTKAPDVSSKFYRCGLHFAP